MSAIAGVPSKAVKRRQGAGTVDPKDGPGVVVSEDYRGPVEAAVAALYESGIRIRIRGLTAETVKRHQ